MSREDIIRAICIVLAAIFKAVADTCAHHFSTSIFKNRNRNFWDNSDYWHTHEDRIPPKRIFAFPVDGWHIANFFMIIFFTIAAFGLSWWVIVAGIVFVIVFNLFYNKVLR